MAISSRKPLGIRLIEHLFKRKLSYEFYQASVLILTFIAYSLYHLSRKPSSIVKNTFVSAGWHHHTPLHFKPISRRSSQLGLILVTQFSIDQINATHLNVNQKGNPFNAIKGWAPFDGDSGAGLLGEIDVAFLATYAVATFFAGHLGDRLCLRWFLTVGMIGSGFFSCLFGLAYWWDVHWLPYFFIVQMLAGLFQATGWPSVVSVMANWFGKRKRGLILGVWNAHTSFGNICGSLIASSLLDEGWGWAFIVPGIAVITGGALIFLFLVVDPSVVGFPSPHTHIHVGQPQSSHYYEIAADEEAPNVYEKKGGYAKGTNEDAPNVYEKKGGYAKGSNEETPNVYEKKGGFANGTHEETPNMYAKVGFYEEDPMMYTKKGFYGGASNVYAKQGSYEGAPNVYAKMGSYEEETKFDGRKGSYEEEAPKEFLASMNEGQPKREGKLLEDECMAVPLLVNYEGESSLCEKVHPVGFLEALSIPGVVPFALCLFFAKLVAYTFIYWLPFYITDTEIGGEYMSDETAGNLSTLFDVGGVVGGMVAGHMSDRLNARASTAALFTWGAIPAMAMYRAFGSASLLVNVSLLILSGLFVNGPYSLITTAVSADLGTHERVKGNSRALATVAAIIDGTGSLGAALGPLFTGYISQAFGWNAVFAMLTLSAFISGSLLIKQVTLELKCRS